MKVLFTFFAIVLTFNFLIGQTENTNYDATLSNELGADDYGMKMYVFVILKTGPFKSNDKKFIDSCFAGHLTNINKLVETKQLIVAGPFGKNENNFRGLFILNVVNSEDAKMLLSTDPAIESGLLAYELYTWYGSAALSEYLPAADKIWKTKP